MILVHLLEAKKRKNSYPNNLEEAENWRFLIENVNRNNVPLEEKLLDEKGESCDYLSNRFFGKKRQIISYRNLRFFYLWLNSKEKFKKIEEVIKKIKSTC